MISSVRRRYMVVIATVVLSLPFAQLPVTTANAAICQGEAAYPPDLPAQTLQNADLTSVQRVIIPFHKNAACETLRAAYGPVLAQHGLQETPDRHEAGSLQFDRAE